MHIIVVIAILICLLTVLAYCVLAAYTRIKPFLEQKYSNAQDNEHGHNDNGVRSSNVALLKKIYHTLDSYAYGFMRYMIIRNGRIPSGRIRRFLYHIVYNMKILKKTVIYGGSEFRSPWNIRLGNCVISNNCLFDGRSGITVADDVVFGTGVRLWTAEHAVNDPMFRVLENNRKPIVIDRRAWICSDSTILPGVHVGEGAVVASRACVTKDCEPFGIYAGVPARKIGERTHDLVYVLDGKPTWHFY